MTQFGVRPWLGNPRFFPGAARPVVIRNPDLSIAVQEAIGPATPLPEPREVPPLRLPSGSYMHSFQRIAMEVAAKYELVSWRELRSKRRGRLTKAKWECWFRCAKETSLSLAAIGRFFGFDHTSIMHGIQQFEKQAINSVTLADNHFSTDRDQTKLTDMHR